MKARFVQLFKDLPFHRKITLTCILISLIPLLLLGIFGYRQISHQLMEREQSVLIETLRQEADIVSNKLDLYQNALDIALWDEQLKNALLQTYETNYDMYMLYKETVDSLFLAVRSLNTDISKMTLYTQADINPHGDYVLPLSAAKELPWYEAAMQTGVPFYSVSGDGQTLYLVGKLYYRNPAPVSVICLAIDMGQMMASAAALLENGYGFLLADAGGALVYDNTAGNNQAFAAPLSVEQVCADEIPDIYFMEQHTIEGASTGAGWTAYLYRPLDDLRAATRNFTATMALLICGCILLSFLTASFLSKIVVSPLEHLSKEMVQVEQGNYQVAIPDSRRQDEVGHLVQAFQLMVKQLNHYINQVLVATINQQKYELRILQSQINPHFLYNSLSLINDRAIMTGQADISKMALHLSKFYRTMLNKGKSVTTVQAELENTRSYVSIQQIMHSNSFDVVYDIDEQILKYSVLNLILQPLAENAILHGLDHKETPEKKVLTISCYEEKDDIVFKVIDNGCGMDERECQEILVADSRGYGVKNVHQRIQLYYGEDYGLQYRSTPGCGTCAAVRIAKKLETKM